MVARDLERDEQRARVAAGRGEQRLARRGVGQRRAERRRRAVEHAAERALVERAELVQPAAREQRADHVVVRVLGRRADERHEPRLDDGQQRVLLRLVEAVDLVEEQDRALPVRAEPLAGPRDHGLHVRLAGVDGRELLERRAGDRGDQPGDRRLARARRPVQDHRAEPVLLDRAPQRRTGPEQVLLAGDLVEAARAQPLGERRTRRRARGPPPRRRDRPRVTRLSGPPTM